jgi:uncharacterized protein
MINLENQTITNLNLTQKVEILPLKNEIKLNLSLLKDTFAICSLDKNVSIPPWATQGCFFSITHTANELSIVCNEQYVPQEVVCDKQWKCLKVEGPLDFSLIGIIANISTALAKEEISIFTISTYDTDYILVKSYLMDKAIAALTKIGHFIKVRQYN